MVLTRLACSAYLSGFTLMLYNFPWINAPEPKTLAETFGGTATAKLDQSRAGKRLSVGRAFQMFWDII
jgi:hypothetical protein